MSEDTYRQTVRELSDQIVEAQTAIRVLNAVKWDDSIREDFFANGCVQQPSVDAAYYANRPLGFDADDLRERFRTIEGDVRARLGPVSSAGTMMRYMCEQFRLVIDMLEARGTEGFAAASGWLYGTPSDVLHVGGPTVLDLAHVFRDTLEAISTSMLGDPDVRDIPAPEAVVQLQQRLDESMGEGAVDVRLDDGIAADAAAGSTYVKLREDRCFNRRDLLRLEAHEGWVHVGTTQNGLRQPWCTFLGKAAPRTTVTQEGLAVLTEIINGRSHPRRLRRLAQRIDGIAMAAGGATFIDVYEAVLADGGDEDEAWETAYRTFRGSSPTGGPFTKDLGYSKGLILTYVYVRLALRLGRLDRIPMLFCGKVDLQDMGVLRQLYEEGIVEPPAFVPPPFDDLPALAAELALSRFQGQLDFDRLSADYERIL